MSAAEHDSAAQQSANNNERPSLPARALSQILERGTRVQNPAVLAYLQRLRRLHPDASPADIVAKLEKRYLAAITASGAAVGTAAVVPGVGAVVAFSAVAGETVVFLEATALFVLAVAAVHGIPVDQRERRRALVLSVLVGEDSKHAIADLMGSRRTGGGWLAESAASLPAPALTRLNARLLRYFAKRYALRRSTLVLGKMLPMGIGAVIGAGGNRVMGKRIVKNARLAFGPAPERWPVVLHLLPAVESSG